MNFSVSYVRELVDAGKILEYHQCNCNTRLLYEESVNEYKEKRDHA